MEKKKTKKTGAADEPVKDLKISLSEKDLKKGKVYTFSQEGENPVEVLVSFNKENLETYVIEKNGNPISISRTLSFIEERVQELADKYKLTEKK